MEDAILRLWTDLLGRLTGPLTLRLILQPTMATLHALRDGVRDARSGRPPYFWTLFTDESERSHLLHEGWKSMFPVVIFGVVMDVAYQVIVFRAFHPIELLIVVFVL